MDKKEMEMFTAPHQSQAKPVSKRKGNPTAIIAAVIGLMVLAIFVIRPAVLGYGVYQQAQSSNLSVQDYAQDMQQLSRDLDVTRANLSSYSTFTGALFAQVEEKNDELTECKVQLERIQADVEEAQKQVADKDAEIATVKSESQKTVDQQVVEKTAVLEQEKTACESSLADKEKAVGEVQAKYDQVVKNAAKSICCKAKVDNPQINFYNVVDSKITCLEQGSNQLNC
ncbi:MAG: hypothetical protein Q8R47_00360 [Nanoarchaeota archaeon]|nr:hypothetical protein [Nanoarchaeota archaeon]